MAFLIYIYIQNNNGEMSHLEPLNMSFESLNYFYVFEMIKVVSSKIFYNYLCEIDFYIQEFDLLNLIYVSVFYSSYEFDSW